MRILVLTLMMSFLGQSTFGAAEGFGNNERSRPERPSDPRPPGKCRPRFVVQTAVEQAEEEAQREVLEESNKIIDALTVLIESGGLIERERNTIIELKKGQEREDDDCGPSEEVRSAFWAAEGDRVKCDESNDISDALTLLIESEGLIEYKSLFEEIKQRHPLKREKSLKSAVVARLVEERVKKAKGKLAEAEEEEEEEFIGAEALTLELANAIANAIATAEAITKRQKQASKI